MKRTVKRQILAVLALLCLGLCACKGTAVMTVGNYQVTEGLVSFYSYAQLNNAGSKEEKEQAQEKAAEEVCEIYKYIVVGEAMGLEIDQDAFEKQKTKYKKSHGTDSEYKSFLNKYGLKDEQIDAIMKGPMYKEAIQNYQAEKEPAAADTYYDSYFREHYRRAKHVLLDTRSCGDSEKAAKKTLAEEILKRAENGESFDKLISEYSEDPGSAANPDGYVFTDYEMVEEFQNAVDSIQEGEFILAESEFGYHVIQRLPLDETPDLYQRFLDEKKDSMKNYAGDGEILSYVDQKCKEYGIDVIKK